MAEAILNHLGKGRFHAFSAGIHPSGRVNPFAIEQLQQASLPTDDLRSNSRSEFASHDAPQLDFVFTVCDNVAENICPVWPGQPMTSHWGIEDPAVEADAEESRCDFSTAFSQLTWRIFIFANLPLKNLDAMSLKRELDTIGQLREQSH